MRVNRLPQQVLRYSNDLRVCVGGIVVSVRCEDKGFVDFLRHQYRNFITLSKPTVSINVIHQPSQRDILEVEDYYHIKQIYFERNVLRIEGDIFSSFFDMDDHWGEISQPLIFQPLDIFIYIITLLYLIGEGAFFLHASGVLLDSYAYVFFGPSGSGKSTVARLSDGKSLAEDIVLIKRAESGHYHAVGTPFLGGQNISASLNGLFRLRKASKNDLSILSPGTAIKEIMGNIPFSYLHPNIIRVLFDAVLDLIKDIACYDLHFLPDRSFWEIIEQDMQ